MRAEILVARDPGSTDGFIRCFKIFKAFIVKAEMILHKIFTQISLKSYHICNAKKMGVIFLTCLCVRIEVHLSLEENHLTFYFMTKPL